MRCYALAKEYLRAQKLTIVVARGTSGARGRTARVPLHVPGRVRVTARVKLERAPWRILGFPR